jgi:hypothetical protein
LLRSAATLALDCGEYRQAERLASIGLAGNPPAEIAVELREVLERALVERLELEGQVVRLEPEVAKVFGSSETVNHALRSLIEAMSRVMPDYYKIDSVKDRNDRWHEITWSPSTGGLMPGRSHYEIGVARSAVEASYIGQAWVAKQ